jgi:hypothetical protein
VEGLLAGSDRGAGRVKAAHEPILDELFKAARANGEHEPRAAYAFDALIEMARRAMGTSAPATDGKKRPPAKYVGILRLDFEALLRGWVEGDETCEIRGLGPIPVKTARELLGDAILKFGDHQGCGRRPRHAPRAGADGCAASCVVVEITHMHRGRLQPHPVRGERPPDRVDEDEAHATR